MAVKNLPIIDVKLEDDVRRTFMLFVQTADIMRKYADARLYREGLSTIKLAVLKILDMNGGTMIPSEIAKWTLRERHDITTLVDRLKKDEYVTTERSNIDKRYINVTITDEGRQALEKGVPVAKEIVEQIMQSVDEDAILSMEETLRVMRQNTHDGLANVGRIN